MTALFCAIAPAMGSALESFELDRGAAPHNPQQPQVTVDAQGVHPRCLWRRRSRSISVDGGKSWAGPVQVNNATDSAREGLHAMSAGPNGNMCCVWLDLRNGKTEVMASLSAAGGVTWSKNVLVYKSPDGSVCECCHPSVAIDGRGRIHVQWRNSVGECEPVYDNCRT